MSINRVNISGHLTRDPELRMTPKGTQVLSFGIAVNDRRLNRETNQWEDYPNFVECTMFGTRAEAVGRIVRKGMKALTASFALTSGRRRTARSVLALPSS